MRIVMHVDLDSFYASLEEQRKPEIQGRPVVVCMFSGRSSESGAVATANYRARELGIRAGMPIAFAKRAGGSGAVFLPADLEYYRAESARIMEIMEIHADSFQQVSIDEAYLDVSSCGSYEKAGEIAHEIKKEIQRMGLTCSVGIAPNKLVAKMASRFRKPDGLTIVEQKDIGAFLSPMPVGKLHGIGGKTSEALASLGIKTAEELAKADIPRLEEVFGRNRTRLLHEKASGIDDSPVTGQAAKQLSRMGTLKEDAHDFDAIYGKIEQLAREMHGKILKKGVYFKTVSVILIDRNIGMQTRSRTIEETNRLEDMLNTAKELLKEYLSENEIPVRRAGIRVSNLAYEGGAGERAARRKEQKSLQEF